MSSAVLTIERRGPVTVLHLDDGKANALGFDMIAAIREAVTAAESDPEVGAVVLHGRQGCFSGGFDLNVMRGGDLAAIGSLICDGGELVRLVWGSGVPVVAACTGHALAAGALLLLGCDVRVGADVDARIGLNEVAIQMVLPWWAVTIATDRLSRRHVHRATANAKVTSPADAVDAGFLDEVVAADQVLERATAVATELATTLHLPSYAATARRVRGAVLDRMGEQIAADRAAVRAL